VKSSPPSLLKMVFLAIWYGQVYLVGMGGEGGELLFVFHSEYYQSARLRKQGKKLPSLLAVIFI
jgi:hypothetical protein